MSVKDVVRKIFGGRLSGEKKFFAVFGKFVVVERNVRQLSDVSVCAYLARCVRYHIPGPIPRY